MKADIDRDRESELDRIESGEYTRIVSMEWWPEEIEYGFIDDIYDSDGHSIVATASTRFVVDGEGLIRVEFAQGTNPRIVAQVLRKMADMLDNRYGGTIANELKGGDDGFDWARRMENGNVQFINARQMLREERDDSP